MNLQQKRPNLPPQLASQLNNSSKRGSSLLDPHQIVQLAHSLNPSLLNADSLDGLNHSHDEQLIQKFLADQYNPEFWSSLLDKLFLAPIGDNIRHIYEACLRLFPLSVRTWKQYIEHEVRDKEYNLAKSLFGRCLPHVLHLDIYTLYIEYVRKTQELIAKAQATSSDERVANSAYDQYYAQVQIAFEFALDHVGYDVKALNLWKDYIDFLKSIPVQTEIQKKYKEDALSLAYSKCLSLPIHNIQIIGKEFEDFVFRLQNKQDQENFSKLTLRADILSANVVKTREKFHNALTKPSFLALSEYSRYFPKLHTVIGSDCDFPAPFPILAKRYNTSTATMTSLLYQRNAVTGNIVDEVSAGQVVDPQSNLPPGSHFDPWFGHWKAVIDYERTNPQRVQHNVVRSRVLYMFKKAMPYCLHSTLFWIDQIDYLTEQLRQPFGAHANVTPQSVESPLLWVNTVYANGNVNFMTSGDDLGTIIQTLFQQCDYYKTKVLTQSTDKNDPKYDPRYATLAQIEQVQSQQKSQYFQYLQRINAYQYYIQTQIYATWEMSLKCMGYSLVLRQYYVDYASSHSFPQDDTVKKAIQRFIDDKIAPLSQSDPQYSVKSAFYTKMNNEITTRSEQLLFTVYLESEHEQSLGSTLAYHLPVDASTLINKYGGLTTFFTTMDLSSSDLMVLFEDFGKQTNTIITLPPIPSHVATDLTPTVGQAVCPAQVSSFAIKDLQLKLPPPKPAAMAEMSAEAAAAVTADLAPVGENTMGDLDLEPMLMDVQQPSAPQAPGGCCQIAPLGSTHVVSVITQKEKNNQNKFQDQEFFRDVPELNINPHLAPISPEKALILYKYATTTANPTESNPTGPTSSTTSSTQQSDSKDIVETEPTHDLDLPLSPGLFTAVIHVTPFRTSARSLDEFPLINFFEHRRIVSPDLANLRALWNDTRKCSSAFNWRSFLYYANFLAIHGTAKEKAHAIVLYTKAEETLLAREAQKYNKQYQSLLRIDPIIVGNNIKKLLFQVEIFIVNKRIEYLERTYLLTEALNVVNKLLQNPLILEPDLQTTYTTLHSKMISLSLAVGVNKGLNEAHKSQLKRQKQLQLFDPVTSQAPHEPQQPQVLQTHQFKLLKAQQALSGSTRFHHHHPKQTVRQLRSQATIQSLIVSSLAANVLTNANTDDLETIQTSGHFVPLPNESSLEIMSSTFPDYIEQLVDPITLGTFRNIPSSIPTFAETALGIHQSTPLTSLPSSQAHLDVIAMITGANDGMAMGLGGAFNSTSNTMQQSSQPNLTSSRLNVNSTSSTAPPHSTIQALLHEPVRITQQQQPQHPGQQKKAETMPVTTEVHLRAPNLRKTGIWTKHDGKMQAMNAFKQPNLAKFVLYDPRTHAKVLFPSDMHYTASADHIMKLVTRNKNDKNYNDDSDDNEVGENGDNIDKEDKEKKNIKLIPVNIDDQIVTTHTLAHQPTFDESGVENTAAVQFKAILKPNLIKLYANQAFTPYIGLVYYNHFTALSTYLRGVCFSNNFLYLFKAVMGTTRSNSDILPKLPSLSAKRAVNFSLLSKTATNAQNVDQYQLDKQLQNEYQQEKAVEYAKITQLYQDEVNNNLDRKATFQLLKRAMKQPGVNLALDFDHVAEKQFTREAVADIILKSVVDKNIVLSAAQQLPTPSRNPQQTNGPQGQGGGGGGGGPMGPPQGPMGHNMGPGMQKPPMNPGGPGGPPNNMPPNFQNQQNRPMGPPGNMGGMNMGGMNPNTMQNPNMGMMRPNGPNMGPGGPPMGGPPGNMIQGPPMGMNLGVMNQNRGPGPGPGLGPGPGGPNQMGPR